MAKKEEIAKGLAKERKIAVKQGNIKKGDYIIYKDRKGKLHKLEIFHITKMNMKGYEGEATTQRLRWTIPFSSPDIVEIIPKLEFNEQQINEKYKFEKTKEMIGLVHKDRLKIGDIVHFKHLVRVNRTDKKRKRIIHRIVVDSINQGYSDNNKYFTGVGGFENGQNKKYNIYYGSSEITKIEHV